MTEVTFITSIKGIQDERVKRISDGLREKRPEVTVSILPGEKNAELLTKFKLKYGPCVMIDGKPQYVGIPSLIMILDRLDSIAKREAEARQAAVTAPTVQSSTAPTKSQ